MPALELEAIELVDSILGTLRNSKATHHTATHALVSIPAYTAVRGRGVCVYLSVCACVYSQWLGRCHKPTSGAAKHTSP